MTQKTILIIAHRLSTVRHADMICVLGKGKIVESGTHEALFEKQGLYYRMWEKQMPDFFQLPESFPSAQLNP